MLRSTLLWCALAFASRAGCFGPAPGPRPQPQPDAGVPAGTAACKPGNIGGQKLALVGDTVEEPSVSLQAGCIPWTFQWTLQAPTGSSATLQGADTSRAQLVPDVAGDYTLSLSVTYDPANQGVETVARQVTAIAGAPLVDTGTAPYACTDLLAFFDVVLCTHSTAGTDVLDAVTLQKRQSLPEPLVYGLGAAGSLYVLTVGFTNVNVYVRSWVTDQLNLVNSTYSLTVPGGDVVTGSGQHAFVLDLSSPSGELNTFDLTTTPIQKLTNQPAISSAVRTPRAVALLPPERLVVVGVSNTAGGDLMVFDPSSAEGTLPRPALGIAAVGNYLALSEGASGVALYDVSIADYFFFRVPKLAERSRFISPVAAGQVASRADGKLLVSFGQQTVLFSSSTDGVLTPLGLGPVSGKVALGSFGAYVAAGDGKLHRLAVP